MAQQSSDSLVSWQCAFWGLVPLALNSMLQPTGRMANFSLNQSFLLRSSPMICTLDALSSCFHVSIIMSKIGVDPLRAVAIWNRSRFPALSEHLATEKKSFESSQILRLIVFVITVSQSAKLLACSGIPYTQTGTYKYILSFAVFAGLQLLASVDTKTQDNRGLEEASFALQDMKHWKTARGLPIFALIFDVGFLSWAWIVAMPVLFDFQGSIFNMVLWKWLFALIPFLFFYMLLLCVASFVEWIDAMRAIYSLVITRSWFTDEESYLLRLFDFVFKYFGHAITYSYQLIFLLLAWWLLAVLGEYTSSAKEAEPLSTGSVRSWKSIWRLSKRLVTPHRWYYRGGKPIRDGAMTTALFLLQVIVCLLWYSRAYKSVGTYKPEWTNKLG